MQDSLIPTEVRFVAQGSHPTFSRLKHAQVCHIAWIIQLPVGIVLLRLIQEDILNYTATLSAVPEFHY